MAEIDLQTWIHNATVGETITYYRGMLMRDRQKSSDTDKLATNAWSLYERGRTLLTQRRVSDSTFDYIITKSK